MWRKALYLIPLGLVVAILGCAAPTAQQAAPQEERTQPQSAQISAQQSTIQNDPSTGEISGSCTLAILNLPSLRRRFDRALYGLKNLANVMSSKTKVNVDLQTGIITVGTKELYSLKAPFLLVKPSRELSNVETQQALANYIQRGGFVLIDGSWQGELIPNSSRSPIPSDHQILLYPNVIRNLPGQLRKMELIQVGGKTVASVTYGELTPLWIGATSAMAAGTVQVKLGVNLIIYALTHSKLCDNSNFDISKDPKAKEYLRKHPPKVELIPEI